MQTHISTTPFGRRPMTLGQMASQVTAKSIPEGTTVEKWKVFRSIREARDLLGATDRSLAILNALLSFHRDSELSGDGTLVVWPSNEQLMARANGMPPTTLRRHLAVLVDCGLIIRRDSPNGKRFARKGRGGEVEQAYGFDLSPIVARAEEFEQLAEAVQAEKKAFKVSKERLTLLRRDIVKMIDAGIEEGVPGNWGRIGQIYQEIIGRLPRTAPRQVVESLCDELQELWTEVHDMLELFTKTQKMDANESQYGRHIQNSNPNSIFESEKGSGKKKEADGSADENDNLRSLPKRELPLGIVLDACPDLMDLAQGGRIRHWSDFLAAVEVARPMLGVSPSAWREACEAMGEVQAAITLAAILQRSDQINSAGGYLRSLTDKAREGHFSTWPMVMALLRSKLDADKAAATTDREPPNGDKGGEGQYEVSEALLKSLNKPRS
ncbi:MAG: replication initiation protein RepC [Hoeflea sp.]|uniref:plasmid replication protein RepC n=1 Tax=Hoeflea sp. TaxID=1940281 RepID=UPI001DA8451B|nr:plasmid replication protein RepC [Hoeflea sp.]MBU4527442.1 replication initiation protein RepC [Alphaproteobacteria bacterium]MBU4543886.1 replication initiation protein RepC [Alphaproteobacteria bacterium]MBU4548828.1 replication initiation protein RepC [Alphaproteobacteria bacterium]MBV1722734.1 replication initiation protein RepC [Hoeflea sp.]MBV1785383.1 replication initiation protein RepC [Hoeflea sp.]